MLYNLLLNVAESDSRRATDWRPIVGAAIEQIAVECSAPDWDGYGARPISDLAKQSAQRFVNMLPADLPAPQAAPDPDGEISLSWDFGPNRVFTVSVAESGTVNYAGILGRGVKRHGQEPYRPGVARILVESIREITPSR